MKIKWTVPALRDLAEIREHIGRDSAIVAADIATRILNSTERLQEFPDSGKEGLVPTTRELIIPGLPYTLVYRVTAEEIQILRVWHDRQSRG
jgi:addiction module RelE/StbE family toxin